VLILKMFRNEGFKGILNNQADKIYPPEKLFTHHKHYCHFELTI